MPPTLEVVCGLVAGAILGVCYVIVRKLRDLKLWSGIWVLICLQIRKCPTKSTTSRSS